MVLKENQYHSTSVLTLLSGMSIPKIKLVYTINYWTTFLQMSDINPSGTFSIPKDLKTIAIFPFFTHGKITDLLAGF